MKFAVYSIKNKGINDMKGKIMRRHSTALILLILVLVLTGCGADKKNKADNDKPQEAAPEMTPETDIGEGKKDEDKPSKEDVSDKSEKKNTLAKRMTGKYSYHYGQGSVSDDEYLMMDVIEFGNNLYAYCGNAVMDDSGDLECYSFWTSEFIPYDSGEMLSETGDCVKVKELRFSIMSNAGMYWDSGRDGKITLTDDGLLFEDFEDEEFLCPAQYGSRLFLKDDRVEDAFRYLKGDEVSQDEDLSGLWVTETEDAPAYFDFSGSDLYIYQKSPDKEVLFLAGGCDFTVNGFKCRANTVGYGMPYDFVAQYKLSGDELTLEMDDDMVGSLDGKLKLRRCNEDDIHLITADEVNVTAQGPASGYFQDGAGAFTPSFTDGFYGIWISAQKDEEAAVKTAEKLFEVGFESFMAYSPEWENLNSDPYYCVSAGRYDSEAEAEADLAKVQAAGYKDAYVKHSGKRKFTTVTYICYGSNEMEVSSDKVIIKDIGISETKTWYPGFDEDQNSYLMTLTIDKDTVFDKTCDTQYFGNYKDGDTPLDWFKRSYDLMQDDPDEYSAHGMALSGVFEVGISGDHIDRYFGSYWWD